MGLIGFLRCPSVAVYFEMKRAKKLAKENGESFDEKEWLKSRNYKGGFEGFSESVAKANAIQEGPVKCPKCGCEQISANKKGFSAKKAIVGDIVAGPVGLVAGTFGSKKVEITCLKCGYKWEAGKK